MKKTLNNFLKKERNILLYVLILSLITFSSVSVIRYASQDNILVGEEPYYHARLSHYISEKGIPYEDPLTGEKYEFQIYHLLLAGASNIIGMHWSSILIPLLLGIISSYLLYLILNKFELNKLTRFIAISIWILSPISIYTFSTSSPFSLALTLLFAAFYLFIQEKPIPLVISAIFAITLSTFNLSVVLFFIAAIISYVSYNKKSKSKSILFTILIIISSIISSTNPLVKSQSITELISDLGAQHGLGIFNILLGIIGLYVIWRVKKHILPNFMLLALLISSFYIPNMQIYINVVFAITASYAITAFIVMRWKLKPIKFLTILIILCGLIFSGISYADRLSSQPPGKEIISSLQWLNKNSEEDSNILSINQNKHWIETIADRNFIGITNNTEELLQTRNLEKAKNILEEEEINYIYITSDMEKKLWQREDQGVLFLFRNKETFKEVYQEDSISIWKILDVSNIE